MLENISKIELPDCFSRICKLQLKNSRISYGEISDILQEDQFSKLYITKAFTPYLKKGGFLGMLTALGWEGFRNRLAEAYLLKSLHGIYPTSIEVDYVYDVLDIENRFKFLVPENNSRVFMLGLYLKLCDIENENEHGASEEQFINIPVEVDEILAKGKSRGDNPDWLILSTWAFYELLGEEKVNKLIKTHHGNIIKLINELSEEQKETFFNIMLTYAFAIEDFEFLTQTKV